MVQPHAYFLRVNVLAVGTLRQGPAVSIFGRARLKNKVVILHGYTVVAEWKSRNTTRQQTGRESLHGGQAVADFEGLPCDGTSNGL
jgi:hypothetical protein